MHSTPSLRRFLCIAYEAVWSSLVQFGPIDNGPFLSIQGRSPNTSSFHASLLQVIDGMTSLALCLQVVSQAPQHFRFSEVQTTYDGCFAH